MSSAANAATVRPVTGFRRVWRALRQLFHECVAAAFALLAVLPFTALTHAAVAPVDRVARRIAAPVVKALRPAWLSVERRTGRGR